MHFGGEKPIWNNCVSQYISWITFMNFAYLIRFLHGIDVKNVYFLTRFHYLYHVKWYWYVFGQIWLYQWSNCFCRINPQCKCGKCTLQINGAWILDQMMANDLRVLSKSRKWPNVQSKHCTWTMASSGSIQCQVNITIDITPVRENACLFFFSNSLESWNFF